MISWSCSTENWGCVDIPGVVWTRSLSHSPVQCLGPTGPGLLSSFVIERESMELIIASKSNIDYYTGLKVIYQVVKTREIGNGIQKERRATISW